MTDLSTSLAEPETPDTSTQLDAPRASDETVATKAAPDPEPKPAKPLSSEDAIDKAFDDANAKDPAPEPKKEADEKPAEPDVKPKDEAEKPAAETRPAPEQERKDGRNHIEPPAKFLPRAKELWINTPREVKSEMQRVMAEAETEITQHREAKERYDSIREYDEIARQNGGDLKTSLAKVVALENAMTANPIAGLNRILQEVGPRKPDGQPFSLYEVAVHIAQAGPQGYQQMVAQQQAPQGRQEQPNPEVEQMKVQLQQMQQQMLAASVIEPFKAEHPRYDELQDEIAFFLQSGKVPTSLSPYERLAAAYDLAVRISPQAQRHPAPAPVQGDAPAQSRAGEDFGGTKSVRGAPASGVETTNNRKRKMSSDEALDAAMSELGFVN